MCSSRLDKLLSISALYTVVVLQRPYCSRQRPTHMVDVVKVCGIFLRPDQAQEFVAFLSLHPKPYLETD